MGIWQGPGCKGTLHNACVGTRRSIFHSKWHCANKVDWCEIFFVASAIPLLIVLVVYIMPEKATGLPDGLIGARD